MGDLGNFSRLTFDPKKHYVGVRLQQGVPLVDADWNEMEDIRRHEQQLVLKWLVGDGVPGGQDDAFSIHYILGTVMNPVLTDFVISNGLCLVDGWEVVNDLGQEENPLKYTDQRLYLLKDEDGELAKAWQVSPLPLLTTVPAMTSTRSDLVYLDVWEREVNWQEDASLVNLQIGVPTCVRRKTEWVVHVREGLADPGELVETLQQDGVWREQHAYLPLAKLVRKISTMVIPQKETLSVEDLRRTGLAVLPGGITIKDGNIGIGTTAPKNKLDVEGAAVIGAAYAGSSSAPDNGLLVEGNVGIGTTTPSVKLEVAGALKATGPLTTTNGAYLATAVGKVGIGTTTPSVKLEVAGALKATGPLTTTSDAYLATADGKVGIGTTTPSVKLEVAGALKATGPLTTTSDAYLATADGKVGIGTITPSVKLEVAGALKATGPLTTTGDAYLATADGKVGIGTTTPSVKLEVAGTLKATGPLTTTSDAYLATADGKVGIGTITPSVKLEVAGALKATGPLTTTGDAYLATADGKVGIGTTTPSVKLEVAGALKATGPLTTTSDAYLATADGKVGIGTITPSVKLEVAGALKATGPLTTTGDAYLATADGKVGIGTDAPGDCKLKVQGKTDLTGPLTVDDLVDIKGPKGNSDALTVHGNSYLAGNLTVKEDTTLTGSVVAGGDVRMEGGLAVTDSTALVGQVCIGPPFDQPSAGFPGRLIVNGPLTLYCQKAAPGNPPKSILLKISASDVETDTLKLYWGEYGGKQYCASIKGTILS